MFEEILVAVNQYNWILTLILQSFIAYHIFYLGKKLNNNERLKHRDNIKKQLDDYIYEEVVKNKHYKVYLLNIKRYFGKYPDNSESLITEYSHIKAEIKSTRYDGVEFFESMPKEIYRGLDGKLYFKELRESQEKIKVFPVGIIPYEDIDFIDFNGDEYNNGPLIFCNFNKLEIFVRSFPKMFYRFPYIKIIYYTENKNYNEENDPYDFKYIQVREKIYE